MEPILLMEVLMLEETEKERWNLRICWCIFKGRYKVEDVFSERLFPGVILQFADYSLKKCLKIFIWNGEKSFNNF